MPLSLAYCMMFFQNSILSARLNFFTVTRLARLAGVDINQASVVGNNLLVVFFTSCNPALGYSGTSTSDGKGERLHKESILKRSRAISSRNSCQKLTSHIFAMFCCAASALSE